MEALHFNARARRRARRRARLRRAGAWLGAVSLAATALGIPGSDAGLRLIGSVGPPAPQEVRVAGVETSESAESAIRFRRQVFDARPVPRPKDRGEEAEGGAGPADVVAETAPAPAGSVAEIIYAAAANHGVAGDYLLSIARCESALDPNATNPVGYHGLFQFDQTTWSAYGYGDIYDPVAQADTAAELIAAGEAERWPNCA